jgi:hypothetical protein
MVCYALIQPPQLRHFHPQTFNPLPLFGGPQYTLRAARGNEGVGVYLRALAQPSSYRAEVSPADPNPPLSCPPR